MIYRAFLGGFRRAVIVAFTLLTASAHLYAQEIPYGASDANKLNAILDEAKTHLSSSASSENTLGWIASAGIASHQLANLKTKGASDDAVRYLKQATELAPDDTLLLAHLGSAYAMAGRDSSFVLNKLGNVNKGLAALDKAVKKDPDNLTIRRIRAGVSYSLPERFARKPVAESDYLFVVNAAQAGASVDADSLAEAYFKLGNIAAENKHGQDAQDFYTQARQSAPESDWARLAASKMK